MPPAAPPQAAAFEGMSQPEPEPGPDGRPQRRSFSAAGEAGPLQTIIIAFICFVLLAGVGTMIYLRITSKPSRAASRSAQQLGDHNLSFESPGEPWVIDEDTRAKVGPPMIVAFKRTEPEAYFAIGAKDYDTREPRPSDLRSSVDHFMDHQFDEVMRTPIPDVTFLGQPAVVAFQFIGKLKDGTGIAGLCYAASYKGIGYWSLSWTGEKDAEGVIQSPNPWTVIAALTKTVQELIARIETLEAAANAP